MAVNQNFESEITYIKGIGPYKAELIYKELGIRTLYELIEYYPFRYIDKSKIYTIAEISQSTTFLQLKGVITQIEIKGVHAKKRLTAQFKDETGTISLVWFQAIKFWQEQLKLHQTCIVFGKPAHFKGSISIVHPEIEDPEKVKSISGNFRPIYPLTDKLKQAGIDSKTISSLAHAALEKYQNSFKDPFPLNWLTSMELMHLEDAIQQIHFPENTHAIAQAQHRLKFNELFFLQFDLFLQKKARFKNTKGHIFNALGNYFNNFYTNHLPFELTNAQKRVIKEIRADFRTGLQMNRLVQGDVGSGKTVVALMCMLMALDNGFQCCLMAPTEILAQQHYETISALVAPLNIKLQLLTGSNTAKEKKTIYSLLAEGYLQIVIGTHALIEDKVQFKQLGLAVIDEQHRFGVAQRAALWKKNTSTPPHILVMTATPIPRTLAMTLYGDLDLSVINELPPGRKPIKTIHMSENNRFKLVKFMKSEIAIGRQVYVIYPLIEESEKLDLLHLELGYEALSRDFPIPDYQIAVIHGRMSADEKKFGMQHFLARRSQIMVATTVIEVGVNVPNASVMVIENAERFGLSQLHQLRGRVGRGADQSYCILITKDQISNEARKRIKAMCQTNDGFLISEIDMEIRGPGEISGTKQSGISGLKLASLVNDKPLVVKTRALAEKLFTTDPELAQPEHQAMLNYFQKRYPNKSYWSRIS